MKKNAFFSYILHIHRLIIIINSFPNPYDFNVFFLESEPSLICKSDLNFLYFYGILKKRGVDLKFDWKTEKRKKINQVLIPFIMGLDEFDEKVLFL